MLRLIYITFLCFFSLLEVCSQSNQQVRKVQYTPNFKFEDGIYLNHQQVKDNNPISKARILSQVKYDDREFFRKVASQDQIYFFNDNGIKQSVETKQIWGYSNNGVLHINLNGYFNRVIIVGSICYFVAVHVSYATMDYYPYYSPYSGFLYNPAAQESTELRQYLLDWEAGRIFEFNTKSVEIVLTNDPKLQDEYMQLKKRKKKQLKFYYLRKFNERNPLFIPVR